MDATPSANGCQPDTTHGRAAAQPERQRYTWPTVDVGEVQELWFHSLPVSTSAAVTMYLRCQQLDIAAVEAGTLAAALPRFPYPTASSAPAPWWARYAGQSWDEAGLHLVLPLWSVPENADSGYLGMTSLLAHDLRTRYAVSATPAGCGYAGHVLAMHGDFLRDGHDQQLLTVVQGPVAYLQWATKPAALRGALLGSIATSSARGPLMRQVPAQWTVVVAAHGDPEGEAQARAWRWAATQTGHVYRRALLPGPSPLPVGYRAPQTVRISNQFNTMELTP